MSVPKVNEYDYINFLIASSKHFSGLEASKVQPNEEDAPSHDSFNRLLYRLNPSSEGLWKEAKQFVSRREGILILDDTTLDKPYSQQIDLVGNHWSGKHHDSVSGINLLTLLWTNREEHIPCDYRIYNKPVDHKTKNDHFRDLLAQAKDRNFHPSYVCFDSWYASLDNLKAIRNHGWKWLSRLKSNRLVNPDNKGNRPVSQIETGEQGSVVHLRGYGMIRLFKIVKTENHIEYWASNDLAMRPIQRVILSEETYKIEHYHRAIKQYTGIEKCQSRGAIAQRNHIQLALRAFLRLEVFAQQTWYSWFELKVSLLRTAITAYLANPIYHIKPTA